METSLENKVQFLDYMKDLVEKTLKLDKKCLKNIFTWYMDDAQKKMKTMILLQFDCLVS